MENARFKKTYNVGGGNRVDKCGFFVWEYRKHQIFMGKIETGKSVIIVLHSPREKLVGVLQEINASGVFLRGIDLDYFDEWTRAIANGETFLPMNDLFFPMWRVERISKDDSSQDLPSHREIFNKKTGYDFSEF